MVKTGHYHFQNRPLKLKNGQHPVGYKNILRTSNK
jgi:hypothetical protein